MTRKRIRISGFSYIRNGFRFGFPFVHSIRSVLPVCDEFVVAVGESDDGTREAIQAIGSEKIRIIDTRWDEQMREGGKIFARQANLALDQLKGDWAFHLQADEIIHENDLTAILEQVEKWHGQKEVEGLLFDFLNFWGDYWHIRCSRYVHRREIRMFRNITGVRSYRDSQGFRIYQGNEDYEKGGRGRKLRVKATEIPVYHYNYVRNPADMQEKMNYFHRFWHDDRWLENNTNRKVFDYSRVDELARFEGTHPAVMQEVVEKQDWKLDFDSSRKNYSFKGRLLRWIECNMGRRLFEYRNYRLI